jgi:hypothetical protein
MTTRLALGALVALGLSVSACARWHSLKTSSSHAAEACAPTGSTGVASVGAATRIASEGMIDVEVNVGAAPSVTISCAPELLPHIHVESRGDLLRMVGGQEVAAEAALEEAVDVARRHRAKSLELRAVTGLARLWADRGQRRQAHDRLSEVYGWFTEGFDTPDLRDARALLDGCR